MSSEKSISTYISNTCRCSRKLLGYGLILTIIFSVYYFFFLEGIPYKQEASITGWLKAFDIPWGRYFVYIVSPLSERLTATQGNYVTVRITEFFFLKALFAVFQDSMTAVAIFNGLIGIVLGLSIFFIAYKCAGNLLVALVFASFIRFLCSRTKNLLVTLLVALTIFKIADKTRHSWYSHQELENIWGSKSIFLAVVYKHATGYKDDSLFPVHRYWYPHTGFTHQLEPYLYYKERHDLHLDSTFAEFLQKYKTVYVGSDHPLELPWNSVLLKEIDGSKLSELDTLKSWFSCNPKKNTVCTVSAYKSTFTQGA